MCALFNLATLSFERLGLFQRSKDNNWGKITRQLLNLVVFHQSLYEKTWYLPWHTSHLMHQTYFTGKGSHLQWHTRIGIWPNSLQSGFLYFRKIIFRLCRMCNLFFLVASMQFGFSLYSWNFSVQLSSFQFTVVQSIHVWGLPAIKSYLGEKGYIKMLNKFKYW